MSKKEKRLRELQSFLANRNVNVHNRVPAVKLDGARFELKAAADGDAADLYIFGDIAWYDITAQMVADALAQTTAGTIRVHVNSQGGDIFEGVAIYNLLRNAAKKAAIEVHIEGLAASIASVIAIAGDEIIMAKNAMMMIHRAWTVAIGDADDMHTMGDLLANIESDVIVPTYHDRTGIAAADLQAMMKAETWMSAQVCVDKGFADKVAEDGGAKALVRQGMYDKMPGGLVAAADWNCAAARDLDIDNEGVWDGDGARERILADAGFNGANPDPAKAKRGFLAYDAAKAKNKDSYKLPFADIKDGKLVAVKSGLEAAETRLPGTDIPENIRTEARAVIDHYESRMDAAPAAANKVARMRARALALSAEF